MKVVSRYCDSCGVKIPAADIQDEVALKYEESYYCKECKAEILPLIEKKSGKGGGGSGTRVAPPVRRAPDAAARAAERPVAKPAAKPVPGKVPSKPGAPAAKRPIPSSGPGRPGAKPALATRPGARKPISRRPVEDEDEEVDSEEELDAEEAPSKRKLLISIGIGAGAVALIVVAVLAFSGGGSTAQPDGPEIAKNPIQIAKEQSEKHWARTLASVKSLGLGEQIKVLIDSRDGISDQGVMDKADAYIEELEAQYGQQGREAFERLYARARQQAEVGAYEDAIATLRSFPEDLRATPWYKSNATAEISKYEEQLAAKNEADPIVRKAAEYAQAKEYRLAIGVLEGFDREEYRSSPWVEKIDREKKKYEELVTATEQDEALDEIEKKKKAEQEAAEAERARKRAEEDKRIAGLNWEQIPTDDLFTWKVPEPKPGDAWKCNKGELTGKCGAAIQGEIGAVAGVGNPAWQDYLVEFRYKIVKGGFRLGVRSSGQAWVEIQPETIADGQWHSMQISVRGTGDDAFEQIVDGVPKRIKFDAHDSYQGGIAFCLLAQSECVFTDLRVKVINKASQ